MDKQKQIYDDSILKMFGLSYDQTVLMFSAQLMLAKYDWEQEKKKWKLIPDKIADIKLKWINEWEKSIIKGLQEMDSGRGAMLWQDEEGLRKHFIAELNATENRNNKTWYYIVVLELLAFVPYTSLGGKGDKDFNRCTYDKKKTADFLKKFILRQGELKEAEIDRLDKIYKETLFQISGEAGKIIINILVVLATGAIAAALCAVGAGAIAVALVGSLFPGLHGAALVAACLAFLGGGAIAAGGAGMAGGVAVIAGGGALLGLAGGGAAVGVGNKLFYSMPEFTLTQAAKLETILKEVVLNTQQDIVSAQKCIKRLQQQIIELNKILAEEKLENEKNKKGLDNMKLSLQYLERAYRDMKKYTSAYEVGMQVK